MGQQAHSFTTTVPISFTPAVPTIVIKPSSNNDHGDTRIIVCALAAPNNPDPGPFSALRKRRTFWAACASCNKKNKHSIEYLDCNISCVQCNKTFKATEVSRPQNQLKTTTENAHSRAIVTSPGTMVEPIKMTATVETPPRKRVKREITLLEHTILTFVTQAVGKHGGNYQGSFNNGEIRRLLISKSRDMVRETRTEGNNMNQ